MILASTFAFFMVISFCLMMVDTLTSQGMCQLGTLASLPTFGQKGRAWLASRKPVIRQTETAKHIITEGRVCGELVYVHKEVKSSLETPIASPGLAGILAELDEFFQSEEFEQICFEESKREFEDAIFHASFTDCEQLAIQLLAKPKPSRDAKGRFKARRSTSQAEVNVNRMAPIPSGFSFFKASYQPQLNKLIYKVQQFLASSAPIITILSITYQTTP